MLDLSDLGQLGIETTDTHETPDVFVPHPLEQGSVQAKVVARVWGGAAGTIVSAAPGAGKTTLVVDVLTHLVMRAGLQVVVATPTREQGYGITARLVRALPHGYVGCKVKFAADNLPFEIMQHAQVDPAKTLPGYVEVRTIDSCRFSVPTCDLMVVDEGYQTTFAHLSSAAAGAVQLLVVGDSGQIGPVVAEDVSSLELMRATPHHRAPDILRNREDFEVFNLGTTYRLGPTTAGVVNLLYPFELSSGRPERHLLHDGDRMPEIARLDVGEVTDLNDHQMLRTVVDRAIRLCSATRYDGDIDEHSPLEQYNVAVVVSRNTQLSLVRGMLEEAGYGDVVVGTANKLQGGQWSAVVALDPLAGVTRVGQRDLSTGLLCVMLSRHTSHLTWVHASDWKARLQAPDLPAGVDEVALGSKVRDVLQTAPFA